VLALRSLGEEVVDGLPAQRRQGEEGRDRKVHGRAARLVRQAIVGLGEPPSGVGAMAYELDSFEVEGVDVAAVLAWAEATASPDRTYTLYAFVHCDDAAGLVRPAGTDPTMT